MGRAEATGEGRQTWIGRISIFRRPMVVGGGGVGGAGVDGWRGGGGVQSRRGRGRERRERGEVADGFEGGVGEEMLCVGVAGTASDTANALLIKHPHSSSPFCSRFSVLDPRAPLASLCPPRRWLGGAARRAAAAAVFFARGASAFLWLVEVGAPVFPKEGRCSVLELGDSESQNFFTQTASDQTEAGTYA